MSFTPLDYLVLAAYLLGVTAFGTLLGRRQHDARDYFLADRSIPWWAICFSVVASETSAITFISIPGVAYGGDFGFLQIAMGFIIGRVVVAWLLLPGYFRGELTTAYQLLEERFGLGTRRFASSIFMVTRAFADSVRVFAAAIPIALVTGLPYWQSIALTGLFTLVYTYYGGIKAVVWVDVIQLGLYLVGGVVALVLLAGLVDGGLGGIVAAGSAADKFQVIHLEGGFSSGGWLLTGLVGGAFLTMASHGTDQLIVQRLLAAPSLRGAQKAVFWSGILVTVQFTLFLLVGVGLYALYGAGRFPISDEAFPAFIVEHFPPGLAGLVVAGILAAAMSTVSSSLNSLSSATTMDIYAPIANRREDHDHLMKVGKLFTLLWAAILISGAILFQFAAAGTPVVLVAYGIASFTYGGLLGAFLLGVLFKQTGQRDVLLGMSTAIVVMSALWGWQTLSGKPALLDSLWFALVGSAITVGVGLLSRAVLGPAAREGAAPRP